MFESSERGRRRSVLFAIVVGTAFLTIAAGAGTVFEASSSAIGIVLLVVGIGLLALGFVIATGKIDDFLFENEAPGESS
jgi:uncharacterized phage infection (PIP) family protein YhgE